MTNVRILHYQLFKRFGKYQILDTLLPLYLQIISRYGVAGHFSVERKAFLAQSNPAIFHIESPSLKIFIFLSKPVRKPCFGHGISEVNDIA
jgi:hypothetical protein